MIGSSAPSEQTRALAERIAGRLESPYMRPLLVGIAGGSCSGKTTLATGLAALFEEELAAVLMQDSYYIDQSDRFDGDGGSVNFDHPSSIDFPLMGLHLEALRGGSAVEVPVYDFATHTRRPEVLSFPSRPLIVVDGTLILHAREVCRWITPRIFVELGESHRFERRVARDVAERGRTPEGVQRQFDLQVKPMHDAFVEPSSVASDLCLSGALPLDEALQKLLPVLDRVIEGGR